MEFSPSILFRTDIYFSQYCRRFSESNSLDDVRAVRYQTQSLLGTLQFFLIQLFPVVSHNSPYTEQLDKISLGEL